MLARPGDPYLALSRRQPSDHGERREPRQVTATQGDTTKQHSVVCVGYGTNGLAELSVARRNKGSKQTHDHWYNGSLHDCNPTLVCTKHSPQ